MDARPPIEIEADHRGPLGMSAARFLSGYWQRHPLLVHGAFAPWQDPLTPEDLAGLACESLALAELRFGACGHESARREPGPFAEQRFAELPEQGWALDVQDVEKWDPDVAALLTAFRFLPRWRLDAVTVSYAAPGYTGCAGDAGNACGDRFLIQGRGRLRCALSGAPDQASAWVLRPGDLLYLPSTRTLTVLAVEPSLMFAVGLQAPSQAELLNCLAEQLETRDQDACRYADADLVPAREPGLIDADALRRVRSLLREAVELDDKTLAAWFGSLVTRPRCSGLAAAPPRALSAGQLQRRLERGERLQRHPFSQLAWVRHGRGALAFADGQAYPCTRRTASRLCADPPLALADLQALDEAGRRLALQWLNLGKLVLEGTHRRQA
jgi:50S ribosomal protein L16 3-hydroxylase